jgi:hypothetical protein
MIKRAKFVQWAQKQQRMEYLGQLRRDSGLKLNGQFICNPSEIQSYIY